jgi:hypothetical protein
MKPLLNSLLLPLLVLLATLAAAIALAKITADGVASAQRSLDAQRAQLREAQTRVQKSGSEKDLIARYLPNYQKLDALGFIGDEQRINWLDALRNVNQKEGLFGINYDIAAKKAYPHAAALGASQLNLSQSVMKLRFQMLHEGDLPKFFEYLAEQNAGVFIVNDCSVRRISATPAARFQPNMSAECELAWITAQPPPTMEERK